MLPLEETGVIQPVESCGSVTSMTNTNRRAVLAVAGFGALAVAAPAGAPQSKKAAQVSKPALRFAPRAFGAAGDGVAKDTHAVQLALDRCAVFGGGEVVVGPGTYLVGAIRIGSNTILRIED